MLDRGARRVAVFSVMPIVRGWFRPGRAFLALLLLTTLVVGEVADARHHLSEQGCAADTAGRPDNCTCASLHALPLGGAAPLQCAPVELTREFAVITRALAPRPQVVTGASPRAPPQG
jgi:hypothetical protein